MKYLYAAILALALGCSGESEPSEQADEEANNGVDVIDEMEEVETVVDEMDDPNRRMNVVCNYANPFSQGPECREYAGDWDEALVQQDCDAQSGEVVPGICNVDETFLGTCVIPVETVRNTILFAYGEARTCQISRVACEQFAKGEWQSAPICDSTTEPTEPSGDVFQPPVLICKDPIAGEPAGNGPDGQVCTWQAISGATEDGRKFQDYASCDVVRTQRPYYPVGRPENAEDPDPRLDDPFYAGELNWVKTQIEATACVCCHAASITPDGASNWDIEQPGNFMNGFFDSGLALGANWIDSVALGAYVAEDNNGFDREISGMPTTDPARMRDFFIAELEYRGLSQDDFVDARPFGGPLYDQLFYEPEACEDGTGIAEDGTITWEGGPARYIYVLTEGSMSPTIPPNLDKPEGTLWRIDVAPDEPAIESGSLKFGEIPGGASQVIPESGEPQLSPTTSNYLYVAADVGIPITRCLTR